MIDFLDELGNFKQKKFYTSKCNFFFTFYNNGPCKFFLHSTTTDPIFIKVNEKLYEFTGWHPVDAFETTE